MVASHLYLISTQLQRCYDTCLASIQQAHSEISSKPDMLRVRIRQLPVVHVVVTDSDALEQLHQCIRPTYACLARVTSKQADTLLQHR
jgi:hypothetical protein